MAMRGTTIRFSDDATLLVHEACKMLGVSLAQFVREAAIMRAMVVLNRDGAREVLEAIGRMAQAHETQRLAARE